VSSPITAPGYRSRDFAAALGAVIHSRTRPYRPATNGKDERFNRTRLSYNQNLWIDHPFEGAAYLPR
jgi:hypothetical protein